MSDAPTHSVDALTASIRDFQQWLGDHRRAWPSEVPRDPLEAAKWFIKIQAKPDRYSDAPRQVAVISGGNRWESPYTRRLEHNFRVYCGLNETARGIVQAAVEDGVFWNGDRVVGENGEPLEFIRIYDETLKMRENPAKHKKEVFKKMKAAFNEKVR